MQAGPEGIQVLKNNRPRASHGKGTAGAKAVSQRVYGLLQDLVHNA